MDERHPWEQLPGESAPAYRAFLVYRDLGAERSINLAGRTLAEMPAPEGARKGRGRGTQGARDGNENAKPTASGRIRKWAKDYRWADRATAYDQHLAKAKVRGETKAVESLELRRTRQALKADEESIALSTALKAKAVKMLEFPLDVVTEETRVTPDGTTIITKTIQPTRWSLRDAARFLEVARDLELTVFRPKDPEAPTAPHSGTARSSDSLPSDDILEEADRKNTNWIAGQTAKLVLMPTKPPGKPQEGPLPA